MFATSPGGPWTSTLTVTIPAGQTASPPFYYEDTQAGAATISGSANGVNRATQTATIVAGPAATVTVSPPSASVPAGASQTFTATSADAYGNPVATSSVAWSTSAPGTLTPGAGSSTTFTASFTATGAGSVVATIGAVSGAAAVTVTPHPVKVSSITYQRRKGVLTGTVTLFDESRNPLPGASVWVSLTRQGLPYWRGRGVTTSDGSISFKVNLKTGCYTTKVTRVSVQGFVWDGRTPRNGVCRPARA
jgi:CO/xanthine dehydrogenase Mo-binding subunit